MLAFARVMLRKKQTTMYVVASQLVLCKQTTLEIDSLRHQQPVKSVSQQRSDVIETFSAVDEPSSRFEYILDAI